MSRSSLALLATTLLLTGVLTGFAVGALLYEAC